MMRFILRNNIYLITLVGVGVAAWLAISWADLAFTQRVVGLFFVGMVLHIWEEMRCPGGFIEMMIDAYKFVSVPADAAHLLVCGYVLYLSFVPLFFPQFVWLAMASMFLGVVEAVVHVAAIKLLHLKRPYSPGMATALVVLLPITIYGFTYAVRHDLMRPWEWLFSFFYMLSGFWLMQFSVVRISGMKYRDFLKQLRKLLAGNRV